MFSLSHLHRLSHDIGKVECLMSDGKVDIKCKGLENAFRPRELDDRLFSESSQIWMDRSLYLRGDAKNQGEECNG